MKTYYLKCKTNTDNIDIKMFIKEQEAKCLLSQLGIKTPLSKIPLLNILF